MTIKVDAKYFEILIIIFLIFSSCSSNSITKFSGNIRKQHLQPFNQSHAEIDIINATLPYLTPNKIIVELRLLGVRNDDQSLIKTDSLKSKDLRNAFALTLMLGDKLLVADSSLIQKMIKNGASKMLVALNKNHAISKEFDTWKIHNFHNIDVHPLIPLTSNEMARMIGGINYSKIIFSKHKNKAAFIYNFERYRNKETFKLCAIEVEKTKGKWTIQKTTCLPYESLDHNQSGEDYFK